MNHHVVTGVGNIYANEALFCAGIRPTKKSSTLSKNKLAVLSVCIRDILARAIDAGGSSLKDFYRTDGSTGYFQNEYMVYGRNDEPCRVCTRPIKVTIVGQRSTFTVQTARNNPSITDGQRQFATTRTFSRALALSLETLGSVECSPQDKPLDTAVDQNVLHTRCIFGVNFIYLFTLVNRVIWTLRLTNVAINTVIGDH